MMRRQQDEQSRVFHDLSRLMLFILRSPPPSIPFSDDLIPTSPPPRRGREVEAAMQQITPAGFASLMLGISLALMLGGSVTFFIGFMLMPWVIGLVMVLYLVGFLTSLSVLGRSVVCYATANCCGPTAAAGASRKGDQAWKLM